MSYLDRIYLERRRRESLVSAANATDPGVERVHLQFAKEYARRLISRDHPHVALTTNR